MADEKLRDGLAIDFITPSFNPTETSVVGTKPTYIRLAYIAAGNAGYSRYYGDTLTWEQLAKADLKWGQSTTILFDTLKAGWTYVYNCVEERFTVTNDMSKVVYAINTNKISNFGITWEILTSHQFWIEYTDSASNIWFLIGTKKPKHKPSVDPDNPDKPPIDPDNPDPDNPDPDNPDPDNPEYWKIKFGPIRATYADQYYTKNLHHTDKRLASTPEYIMWTLDNKLEQDIQFIQEVPTIIRSSIPVRDIRGDFTPQMVIAHDKAKEGQQYKERSAVLTIQQHMTLLLALVGANLYYHRGNPVIEPWMLWEIWKWLGQINIPEAVDTIFDIMPNWGE
mgnify:FL=1|jgi:hypothetical protein